MDDPEKNPKKIQQMGRLMTLPFVLAVPPIVGWFIGSAIDKAIGTKPYLSYLFIFFGLASGVIEFFRIVKNGKK